MTDRRPPREHPPRRSVPPDSLLESALEQFREECRRYNEAVGSYNTHLDNHRDRRDLHDVPFRSPITAHDAFEAANDGDRVAVETLLEDLIDRAHLDSQLRRHPRVYPIHVEATEHLDLARDGLVTTLEELLQHAEAIDG
ncbi:hypothetical protein CHINAEXTREME_14555 [Halobiforma lacisalsi AJ5]|uniref:Uncharacterized protein n=1 Tax=Natronobacterium lacisalsi AJ5 TaxID=358396 RepID=M0L162_NATLA|nr:hypothetical protein [Halobiforma lacisalsi]APW98920.1 hypothetical protein CHINAEXTREME_14555 [Halobiforma lacisalsi AJ5]EMA27286.1 hypothetical protein C445_20870 [Halobiforma lacisalsi AJ5]